MKFKTHLYADISTAYLHPNDLDLLATAPNHLAQLDDHEGDFFFTPTYHLNEFTRRCKEHGMSARFIEIMDRLAKQGIPYVRFDRDGGDIEDLVTFKHK